MFRTINMWFGKKGSGERKDAVLFGMLLFGATAGLLASFVLSVEAIELAKNPNAELPCSINALVNCATVGTHESASVLGFPNSFLGLVTLPVMITIAVAGLFRVRFPRLFMFGAQVGATLGLVFAAWMLYVSYAVIQVFCPWCLLVDSMMLVIFFAVTRYNILHDNLFLSKDKARQVKAFVAKDFDLLAVALVFILSIFAILIKYRDSLLG